MNQIQAALDFDARPRYARNSETGRAAQASAEPKAGTKRMRPTESLITRARDSGSRESRPSLDRFIPANGYVIGNIRVISFRANRIKSDATLEEMRRVLSYMEGVL